MKLIIGLGNPGKKYQENRHNIGYILLDKFAEDNKVKFSESQKMGSLITQVGTLYLCKPNNFMNNSGDAVSKMSTFYKISPEDILVIHDDLDLEFGTIKLQRDKSAAGHNGVQDIINKLGTKNFWRLRIGIGRPSDQTPIDQYVLNNLSSGQIEWLRKIDLHEYILVDE